MSLGFSLPVLFGYFVFRLLRRKSPWPVGWREACLAALVATGLYLVLVTETLSLFRALVPIAVWIAWLGGDVLLLALGPRLPELKPPRPSLLQRFRELEPLARLLYLVPCAFAGVLLVIAAAAIPNSWDALSYHLPRVAHWYQNHSIGIFATNSMYQDQHGPFAEWSILNLFLLQGRDQLANLVAWTGYAGSILAVSLLAEACGGGRLAGALGAFFAATLPMAILQASGVQTDEILSLWLLTAAYACLRATGESRWPWLFLFGASLGLALLTKATACLFAFPICVWLTIALLRRDSFSALPKLVLVALLAVALNTGYWTRNWTTSGTLLGSTRDSGPGFSYENEIHTPAAIASNIVRNLALHTPQFPWLLRDVENLVDHIHAWLGLSAADPRLTQYQGRFHLLGLPLDDEVANPLHLLLIAAAFIALPCAGNRIAPAARRLALCVLAGAFLFCFVLKWQPFHSRLQLPLFLLALPVAAAVAGRMWRPAIPLLVLFLFVPAVPLLFGNIAHPLFGPLSIFRLPPDEQRFFMSPPAQADYERAVEILRQDHVATVGVIGPPDNSAWEYPLFAPDDTNPPFPWRIEDVNVTNFYARLETPSPPDAVVSLVPATGDSITLHGATYHRRLKNEMLSLYLK
jgi:4-amino-4-deoxy-L-arabinose transferase-like glycosyltransferase